MARPLRLEYSGAVYHVTSRGNAQNPIFHSDNDRNLFLEIIHKVTERFHWLCHVYCLMDNHYHLVVEAPEGDWKWSSYRATAGIEKPHECLVVEWVLGQFYKNRQEEKRYREFVQAGIRKESIWEKVKGQALLGNEEFREQVEKQLQGKRDIGEIPRSQRYADRPSLEMLFRGVEDMGKRNQVIREAVGTHGYRQSEVAAYIGIHYSTTSKILSGER